jgi:mycobactin peptide synthetase MbtE
VDHALDDPDRPISELDLMDDAGAGWLRRVSSGDGFHTPSKTLATLVETQVAAHLMRRPSSTTAATSPTAT